ncbi:Uncharacterized protein HZ326_29257 [Fusarium oxysporum f. sp. albedinis]|nr:Uncharacterized protein HZ326_29257 [Fusarium oxysporum f. sp. albedinis]
MRRNSLYPRLDLLLRQFLPSNLPLASSFSPIIYTLMCVVVNLPPNAGLFYNAWKWALHDCMVLSQNTSGPSLQQRPNEGFNIGNVGSITSHRGRFGDSEALNELMARQVTANFRAS